MGQRQSAELTLINKPTSTSSQAHGLSIFFKTLTLFAYKTLELEKINILILCCLYKTEIHYFQNLKHKTKRGYEINII